MGFPRDAPARGSFAATLANSPADVIASADGLYERHAASRARLEHAGTDRFGTLRRPEADGRGSLRLCPGARRNLELSWPALVGPRLFLPEGSGRAARRGGLEGHPA